MHASFSRRRRREANENLPQVIAIRALGQRFGPHSGSSADSHAYRRLVEGIADQVPVGARLDTTTWAPLYDVDARRCPHSMAAHAAWAVAASLPNSSIVDLTRIMGNRVLISGATVFTDEFPGLVKSPILGKRIRLWRSPAAVAAILMHAYADSIGIR